jgi:nucleoside-diphosphate-sugar epimerase
MKNIGILGGTRFIGYHLTRILLTCGYRVSLFNRGQTREPEHFPSEVRRFKGDRNNPKDLAGFLNHSYDVVFDLSGYTPNQLKPFLTPQHRDKIGHFVFCSTSSVYKVPPPFNYRESAQLTTMSGTYGGDKALAEKLLMHVWNCDGWPVTIFRPQAVFGPYGAAQPTYVFSRLLHSWPILLGRNRGVKLSFLYIGDLITSFIQVMNNRDCFGKIYNLAGDEGIDQVEYVNLCSAVSDLKPDIRFFGVEDYSERSIGIPWMSYDLVPDTTLIKTDLSFNFTPLRSALQETWNWLLNKSDNLKPELFRGEQYLLANRPIPVWAKTWWTMEDLTKAWPLVPRIIRFLKSSSMLRNPWQKFKKFRGQRHLFS